jgi:hypothetical protein
MGREIPLQARGHLPTLRLTRARHIAACVKRIKLAFILLLLLLSPVFNQNVYAGIGRVRLRADERGVPDNELSSFVIAAS